MGPVIWLTGLPASGKTTLARGILEALAARGTRTAWLDSDELRAGSLAGLGYSARGRDLFYTRLVELAVAAAQRNETVVISATAPQRVHRDTLRALVPTFLEVWVRAPKEELERRDPKGLYASARAGAVSTLPGVGVPFEEPHAPEVVVDTHLEGTASAVARILAVLEGRPA